MLRGKVVEWNDERGFGFILPDDGGRKVFFHISNFPKRHGRPNVGQECFLETLQSDRGEKAVDLVVVGATTAAPRRVVVRADESNQVVWVALFFLVIVTVLALAKRVPPIVPIAYIAGSIFAIAIYKHDKMEAERQGWRVSEGTLHLISLLGGWPGALFAQQRYRHKTQKTEFRVVFWMTVVLNCAVLGVISWYGAQLFMPR